MLGSYLRLLTILANSSFLDVWQGIEYASVTDLEALIY